MAVLVEAISVIVRTASIEAHLLDGWRAFVQLVPNRTLCADTQLARVGFMHPDDVKAFVEVLEKKGLEYLRGGKAVDMVVVDQQRGPLAPAEWIEFGTVSMSPDRSIVSACRLKGSIVDEVATPADWSFEGSLSQTFGFARSEANIELTQLEPGFLQAKGALWSNPMYVGRTSGKKDSAS